MMTEQKRIELTDRITEYLVSGGLFNPEMALHDRVRDLLIDIRAELSEPIPDSFPTLLDGF